MSQIARANKFFNRTETMNAVVLVENIEVKVRRCIRGAGGLGGLNPDETDMPDSADLKINYKFTNKNYDSLFTRMNILLRNENAPKRLLFAEVNNCKTVGDCAKLVKSKMA